MKSVGEVMAIGRTFKESLLKAVRSLEIGRYGLQPMFSKSSAAQRRGMRRSNARCAGRIGNGCGISPRPSVPVSTLKLSTRSRISTLVLANIQEIVEFEERIGQGQDGDVELLREAKELGYADRYLATLLGQEEQAIRAQRLQAGINATFKRVDTCAAEFEAATRIYTPHTNASARPTHIAAQDHDPGVARIASVKGLSSTTVASMGSGG